MKKRMLFCLTFAVAATLLSAQSNCFIGLHGGITQSRFYSPDGLNYANEREIFIRPNFGISLRHDFKEKFYWQANLQYQQFGEQVLLINDLRWPSEQDGNGGYTPDPNLPHRLEYYQKTDYVSFRAGVGYYLWRSEKFRLGVMPFAAADFFIKNKEEQRFVYDDGHFDSEPGTEYYGNGEFRKVNPAAGLALSFQAKLSPNLDVFLSPDATIQLMPTTTGIDDTHRYHALGLNAGIFYRL
ncbi:MAG: hypothetical protein HUU01_06910 [Saprospiraceae bacterium]|nr:hypothetical protein [Saprospiraceae bacterium]